VAAAPPVPEPARELAERDDAQEDQADDQHHEDHVAALLGGRLLRREDEREGKVGHQGAILIDPLRVQGECACSRALTGHLFGQREQLLGIAGFSEREPGILEAAVGRPEQRDGCRPRCAVLHSLLGLELRAQREELSQVGDDVHLTDRSDADEAVRVEVVAEQDRGVAVGGREEPRTPVVEKVALVDRFEPDREALRAER
jgi:hypothetical protein